LGLSARLIKGQIENKVHIPSYAGFCSGHGTGFGLLSIADVFL